MKIRNKVKAPNQITSENRESKTSNVFETIREKEKEEIINALMGNQGNVTRTAKALGISRQALIYRMKKYKIK